MIRPGDEWGTPTDAAPDLELRGDDAALAATVGDASVLVRFDPVGSELARAIGLASTTPGAAPPLRGIALPIDAITTNLGIAVNAMVVGTPPARLGAHRRRRRLTVVVDGRTVFDGRATSVVVANGQFLDGVDLVPRGHPGDGRIEVQVYALAPAERRPMRRRLPTGSHVPHPHIVAATGRSVEIRGHGRPWRVALDGHAAPATTDFEAAVLPGALRLLI